MRKDEIFEKLRSLPFEKDKFVIISGASLVVQGIIEETPDIDLSTTMDFYKTISWEPAIGAFGVEIKRYDCFDISFNLYPENHLEIDGFRFMTLSDILKVKKALNRDKDKYIIEKLEKGKL